MGGGHLGVDHSQFESEELTQHLKGSLLAIKAEVSGAPLAEARRCKLTSSRLGLPIVHRRRLHEASCGLVYGQ